MALIHACVNGDRVEGGSIKFVSLKFIFAGYKLITKPNYSLNNMGIK